MNQIHKCWLWKGLWGLSALALLFAWWTLKSGGMIVGIDSGHWFLNAFALGILAIPIKLDCQACQVCR